jgi:hypothetical protein
MEFMKEASNNLKVDQLPIAIALAGFHCPAGCCVDLLSQQAASSSSAVALLACQILVSCTGLEKCMV